MADTKISADPAATAVGATDKIPVIQGGTNKALSGITIAAGSSISNTNTGDQSLAGLVPTTRTVNGVALSADVSVTDANLLTSDVTTNNVSTTKHGYAPKSPNDATKYLDGTGAYTVPAAGASSFIGLTDVPATFTGQGTKSVRVNSGETALEFFTPSGGGGGDALVANPLSQFAATTSAQLKTVISDETGTGALVFATSPALVTPTGIVKGDVGLGSVDNTADASKNVATAATFTTPRTINGVSFDGSANISVPGANLTGPITSIGAATSVASQTGTGSKFVMDTSPNLITPAIGAATGTSLTVTGLLKSATLQATNGFTMGDANANSAGLTWYTGINANSVSIYSGVTSASYSLTLPTSQGAASTLLTNDGNGVLSWTTPSSVAAAGTLTGATLASNVLASSLTSVGTLATLTVTAAIVGSVTGASGSTTGNAATVTNGIYTTDAVTGTGSLVRATSPTFVTPVLGTPTSVTLTNATGLPISTGVSGLATGVATFLGTSTSANLASAMTDETGSGALVFATSPTLVTPALGTPSAVVLTNATGTAAGLTAGAVTGFTAGAGTLTGPATSGTAATLANAETLTNKRNQPRVYSATNNASLTPEIATYDIFHLTAMSAATTINNHATSTPADGELMLFRFLDNATARALTWGTNYVAKNGTALPTTTTLSKNMTVLFEWNQNLSKWNLLTVGTET